MSFRTVVISKASRINYKNRFLIVKDEENEKYVHLSEIDTLIIDSISVSISTYLLKELSDNKINVIFCDEKHNPFGELSSYYGRHNSSKKMIKQTKWTDHEKDKLWQNIVKNKITNQALLLSKIKSPRYDLVFSYINEVELGDKTNREGHAAKVYFNELFGKKFTRNDANTINAALNYGYAILLSTINKEVAKCGYITQLGIHHKNEYNNFNLSCDLMEPFRVIIDNFVYYNKDKEFNTEYKMNLVNIFNHSYSFKGKKYTLKDIISLYTANTLDNINSSKKYERFIYEEQSNENDNIL